MTHTHQDEHFSRVHFCLAAASSTLHVIVPDLFPCLIYVRHSRQASLLSQLQLGHPDSLPDCLPVLETCIASMKRPSGRQVAVFCAQALLSFIMLRQSMKQVRAVPSGGSPSSKKLCRPPWAPYPSKHATCTNCLCHAYPQCGPAPFLPSFLHHLRAGFHCYTATRLV